MRIIGVLSVKFKSMKPVSIIIVLFLLGINLRAQQLEVVNSGGGCHENNEGSITFSIGEIVIETLTHGDCCLTQGFCQANITVTAINKIQDLDYELSVYPNPTKDFVILKVNKDHLNDFKYLLFDMNGRLIKMEQIVDKETVIPFNFLIPSIYYLKIINQQSEQKTFKIVKSN